MKRFFFIIFAEVLCWIALGVSPARSQDAPRVDAGEPDTEKLFEQIADGGVRKMKIVETYLAVVEGELSAGRLSVDAAASLRTTARRINLPSCRDVKSLVSRARPQIENAAISVAADQLEKSLVQAELRYQELISECAAAIQRNFHELSAGAPSAGEISTLISLSKRCEVEACKHPASPAADAAMKTFRGAGKCMRIIADEAKAHAENDEAGLRAALKRLAEEPANKENAILADDLRAFLARFRTEVEAGLQKAQAALETAAKERRPPPEIWAALDRWEGAFDAFNTIHLGRGEIRGLPFVHRAIAGIAVVRSELPPAEFKKAVEEARKAIRSAKPEEAPAYAGAAALLDEWAGEAGIPSDKSDPARSKRLKERLDLAKRPADLRALARELEIGLPTELEESLTSRGGPPHPGELDSSIAARLARLAGLWEKGDLPNLRSFAEQVRAERTLPAPGLEDLCSRIERRVTICAIHAPELDDPTLASLPISEALDQLLATLQERGDWRRALTIMEFRGGREHYVAVDEAPGSRASAIRSFLSAQAFEMAGLWAEAEEAYGVVLKIGADHTPGVEAAIRVLALQTEHPRQ